MLGRPVGINSRLVLPGDPQISVKESLQGGVGDGKLFYLKMVLAEG